jgi:hypothetical protein
MRERPLRAIFTVLIVLAVGACGSTAPSGTQTPSPVSFAEYATAFCASWVAMFEAVGNPDTGSSSALGKSLDGAVAAGDLASADSLAATIMSKLETSRHQAAIAGRWPSAGPMIAEMDHVLVAFEAMIAAKRAAATHAAGAVDPQIAFEKAGGALAWPAMLRAYAAVARPSGMPGTPCVTVPITP